MTHPAVLSALAALSALTHAYPRLAEAIEAEAVPTMRRRPRSRGHLTEQAATAHDTLLRAERADRIHADRQGVTQTGASPAPIRIALLDAQIRAESTVEALCWDLGSLLANSPERPPVMPGSWHTTAAERWETRTFYLMLALEDVATLDPKHTLRAGQQLARANDAVRSALGMGPSHVPLPGDRLCPACGRATLRAEVSAEDERGWTVSCRPGRGAGPCSCVGTQCSCRRPGRTPGQGHTWPMDEYASNFGELRGYLRAMRAVEDGAVTFGGHVWVNRPGLQQLLPAVTDSMLKDWCRRKLVEHRRIGRWNWYRLDQAVGREETTKHRGRPRTGRRQAAA